MTIGASLFSEALLAQAMEKAANPLLIIEHPGRILWCNPAYSRMVGKPTASLIHAIPASLVATRENFNFFAEIWTTVCSGKTWAGELQERHPDGSVIHVDCVFTPLDLVGARKSTKFLVLQHDVTHHKSEYERVWREANHDRLTGLANRGLCLSSLELIAAQNQRNGKKAAVLFIDLDNFKKANDLFSHDGGDRVLVQAAEAIKAAVRKSDIVARFGGDEFVCVLDDIEGLHAAGLVAQKIIDGIGGIELGASGSDRHVRIGASIGLALCPDHGTDQGSLRHAADLAMYAAKRAGKNCWKTLTDVNEEDRLSAARA